jgi:hypothetical protein
MFMILTFLTSYLLNAQFSGKKNQPRLKNCPIARKIILLRRL